MASIDQLRTLDFTAAELTAAAENIKKVSKEKHRYYQRKAQFHQDTAKAHRAAEATYAKGAKGPHTNDLAQHHNSELAKHHGEAAAKHEALTNHYVKKSLGITEASIEVTADTVKNHEQSERAYHRQEARKHNKKATDIATSNKFHGSDRKIRFGLHIRAARLHDMAATKYKENHPAAKKWGANAKKFSKQILDHG